MCRELRVMSGLISVAVGSVLGAVARYFVSGFVARRVGETFPWGTLIINVSGAFAIGVLGGLPRRLHHGVLLQPANPVARPRPRAWPRGELCGPVGRALSHGRGLRLLARQS